MSSGVPEARGPCPCGRGAYVDCCGPLHEGLAASSAEALMRSRFSAYALGRADYLRSTWAVRTRPVSLRLDERVVWRRLQIVDTVAGGPDDESGVVEFRATYVGPDGFGVLHERSRFSRAGARWVYDDGDLLA